MFNKSRKTVSSQNGSRRARSAAGALLFAVLSSPVFAESFVGEWVATAEVPGGGVSETLLVEKVEAGYTITVKLLEPMPGIPEASPGQNIKVVGDNFSYTRTIGELEIVYSGAVSGDTFAGTVSMGGAQIPYTGVRRANEK